MTVPKISLQRFRQIVNEEIKKSLVEDVERDPDRDRDSVYNSASKLKAAVKAFKEKATPEALAAVESNLEGLEKLLQNMCDAPGSYVMRPKPEPKKVTLKPVASEGHLRLEATGDGGPELVDAVNFGHLEVGNTYMCEVGREHVRAVFKGWVDANGQPTESEDPEQVRLMFADEDDGMEWEAYFHDGSYCAGSSADPLYVEEM